MNCKAKSVCFGAVALGGLMLVLPAEAQLVQAPSSYRAPQGGQAPPNPAGGSARFLVVVARNLPSDTADALRRDLIADGFTTAESRPDTGENFQVVLGGLPSEDQADNLMRELKASGYTPESVSGDGDSTLGTAAPESIFRVKVAEFETSAEAQSGSKTLDDEGFVNVDVVEEDGKFMLMLGTFNRREDAEALLSDVASAGFALADVVSRERLRGSASGTAGTADLSGLSVSEQAATRDVLSMAEKVETGEATAAEIKELRERIQQLSETQRNVVARQEDTRATEREKMAKIFPLYRKFDQAIAAKDLVTAEQTLAEVRQIDPSDIFLPGRVTQLEQVRTGGAAAAPGRTADPAQVQRTINEARRLEAEGNRAAALEKYREAAALDPQNSDARGKIAELGSVSPTSVPAQTSAEESGSIMDNKALVYGGGGLLALIILGLLFKSKRKTEEPTPSSSTSTAFGTTGSDFIDPLSSTTGTTPVSNPDFSALGSASDDANVIASGAGGAEMAPPAFATFGIDEDEEEAPKPVPPPAPAPVEEESDTVSFESFDMQTESAPAPQSTAIPGVPAADTEEPLTINFDEESPAPTSPTPAHGSGALNADLESMLKGTFPGAPADPSPVEPAVANAVNSQPVPAAEPRLIYEQTFDNEQEGGAPAGWRGEYDYASLTVERLEEPEHSQCLCFHKTEGAGSATYHLTFPKATGRVIAEFDIRCEQKNKFLLGVYLEKNEDFKQSIHTIVHQLDANSPAALRIQGVAAPYEMTTWRRVRFQLDLENALVDGYVDDVSVVNSAALPSAPDYINTISIRDNLATTGTLLIDNIRIWEA